MCYGQTECDCLQTETIISNIVCNIWFWQNRNLKISNISLLYIMLTEWIQHYFTLQIQMLYSLIGLFHRKSILFDINSKSHKVIQRKFIQSQSQPFRGNSWVRSVWGKEMIQMCHGNSLPSVWEVPTYPAQFRSVWEKGKEMTATHSQAGLRPESQTGVGGKDGQLGNRFDPFSRIWSKA